MNWFEEWFDSPYYHTLYKNRNEEEAELFLKRLVNTLKVPQNSNVLDAACGRGRHSRVLASLGFDVTGIDLSKASIDYANEFESSNLHFSVFDMRNVFKEEYFDYVFNLFSSFGYFKKHEDDDNVIKAFSGNLKSGGVLVLDYLNTDFALMNLKPKEIINRDGIQFHISRGLSHGFIKKKIEFLVGSESCEYEEQLRVISLSEFEVMLGFAGFKLMRVFGDYELNKFVSYTSPRLILVATKA